MVGTELMIRRGPFKGRPEKTYKKEHHIYAKCTDGHTKNMYTDRVSSNYAGDTAGAASKNMDTDRVSSNWLVQVTQAAITRGETSKALFNRSFLILTNPTV